MRAGGKGKKQGGQIGCVLSRLVPSLELNGRGKGGLSNGTKAVKRRNFNIAGMAREGYLFRSRAQKKPAP